MDSPVEVPLSSLFSKGSSSSSSSDDEHKDKDNTIIQLKLSPSDKNALLSVIKPTKPQKVYRGGSGFSVINDSWRGAGGSPDAINFTVSHPVILSGLGLFACSGSVDFAINLVEGPIAADPTSSLLTAAPLNSLVYKRITGKCSSNIYDLVFDQPITLDPSKTYGLAQYAATAVSGYYKPAYSSVSFVEGAQSTRIMFSQVPGSSTSCGSGQFYYLLCSRPTPTTTTFPVPHNVHSVRFVPGTEQHIKCLDATFPSVICAQTSDGTHYISYLPVELDAPSSSSSSSSSAAAASASSSSSASAVSAALTWIAFSNSASLRILVKGSLYEIVDNSSEDSIPAYLGQFALLLSQKSIELAKLKSRMEKEISEKTIELAKSKSQMEKEFSVLKAEAKREAKTAEVYLQQTQTYVEKLEASLDSLRISLQSSASASSSQDTLIDSKPLYEKLEADAHQSLMELRQIHKLSPSLSEEEEEAADEITVIPWEKLKHCGQEDIGFGGVGRVSLYEMETQSKRRTGCAAVVAVKLPRILIEGDAASCTPIASKAVHDVMIASSKTASLKAELAVLSRSTHPNLVRLLGITATPKGYIGIVQQYCRGGDLSKFLEQLHHSSVTGGDKVERTVFDLVLQIAQGLAALHSLGAVHRDLKPSNVLLCPVPSSSDPEWVCKIADLGSSSLRMLSEEMSQSLGLSKSAAIAKQGGANVGAVTARYRAPELIGRVSREQWKDSVAQDLFAFGLLLYEAATGRQPFADYEEMEVAWAIGSGQEPGQWNDVKEEDDWKWLRDLSEQCRCPDPKQRVAHFSSNPIGRDAFDSIVQYLKLCKPDWAKESLAKFYAFERREIRDPFLSPV